MIYAINRKTKEHRICRPEFSDHMLQPAIVVNAGERTVEADDEGWIAWEGGECPLPPAAKTEIRTRDGSLWEKAAGGKRWNHDAAPYDIIAYRPILDQRLCFDCGSPLTADERHYLEVQCNECAAKEVHQDPEAPAWDGEGKPQIGHRVSCISAPEYEQMTVVYTDGDMAWLRDVDTRRSELFPLEDIRPIRSAEEKAVEELASILSQLPMSAANKSDLASYLYLSIRDGKIPGVTLAK